MTEHDRDGSFHGEAGLMPSEAPHANRHLNDVESRVPIFRHLFHPSIVHGAVGCAVSFRERRV